MLDRKNTKMDEYIGHCAEYGGRPIVKQEEPLPPPSENPLILEMRMMHMDFVEESYFKRLIAFKIAKECEQVAIEKARQRIKKRKLEEQRALLLKQ